MVRRRFSIKWMLYQVDGKAPANIGERMAENASQQNGYHALQALIDIPAVICVVYTFILWHSAGIRQNPRQSPESRNQLK
jgi:hypothetical protein